MGMGNTVLPFLPWVPTRMGTKLLKLMGMGREWE